jgi:hypothetical protein
MNTQLIAAKIAQAIPEMTKDSATNNAQIIQAWLDEEQLIDDTAQQIKQLQVNCQWLRERIDDVHDALCPGQIGTWQQRAEQAALAAQQLAQERVAKAQLAAPTGNKS